MLLKPRQRKLWIGIIVFVMVCGLYASIRMLRSVEYYGRYVDSRTLIEEVGDIHCVQRPFDPPLTMLSEIFPRFICFDTLEEADTYTAGVLRGQERR